MNRKTSELISKVVNAIKEFIGLDVEVKTQPELMVTIINGGTFSAHLCIRSLLRTSTVGLILKECQQVKPSMIFSSFISKPVAEILRKNKIWFADPLGNVYIEVPGRIFVYTIGKTPRNASSGRSTLITESGARLMLFILTHGPEIMVTYRKIAEESGLSLGRTSYLMKALLDSGIVVKEDKRYLVTKGNELFEIWIQAYLEKLKPKRFIAKYMSQYQSDLRAFFESVKKLKIPAGVGDELAGEILTNYLKAQYASLWIRWEDFGAVREALKLLKTEHGNIRIYEHFNPNVVFWSEQPGIMPIPMVIGDLLETDDVRNRETAKMLQEKFLKWTL